MATCNQCSRGRHDCSADYCSCDCRPKVEIPDDLPTFDLSPQAWHARAACHDAPTDLFYSEAGSRRDDGLSDLVTLGRPQRVCARCPIRRECLADALRAEQGTLAFGVWGGVGPRDRHDPALRGMPLNEKLDALEARFREQVPHWLLPSEEIVD